MKSETDRRAKAIKKLIDVYGNDDVECDIIDALTDLRNLCDKRGFDFYTIENVAYDHYSLERHAERGNHATR